MEELLAMRTPWYPCAPIFYLPFQEIHGAALPSDSNINVPRPSPDLVVSACRRLRLVLFWLHDQSLGLSEFSEVLANPPPGIDELVALSRVLKLARSEE